MTDKPRTSGEQHIDNLLQELDPSSERYQTLATAKKFKSSWVELGERLLKVNAQGLYKEWGFENFEDYCLKEIRIRQATAQKLTLAYRFLEKQEPELLQRRNDLKPLPDYRSVDLLRQAKEERGFSEEEYGSLRRAVVEEEKSHPTALKQFKDIAETKGEEPQSEKDTISLKLALAAARRLSKLLQELNGLDPVHQNNLDQIIKELEAKTEASTIREVAI